MPFGISPATAVLASSIVAIALAMIVAFASPISQVRRNVFLAIAVMVCLMITDHCSLVGKLLTEDHHYDRATHYYAYASIAGFAGIVFLGLLMGLRAADVQRKDGLQPGNQIKGDAQSNQAQP